MQFEPLTDLRDPAVVIAFSGWNDAANAASDLAERLIDGLPGDEMQPIDDENFFDFQATRPVLKREADGPWIQWPGIRLRRVRHPERDIVVVLGPEPNLRWRSFCQLMVERLSELEPTLVVAVGAMLSDTPHSRPFPLGLYAASEQLQDRLGFETSDYSGPTGIVGVLTQALAQAGLPTASLWVSVPHYVANPPNPKAQLQLMERLETVLGVTLDRGDLHQQAEQWVTAVDELAGQDPDIEHYIEQLEEARDQEVVEENSGDRIAAEFERYLRGRNDR
ncbi:PAC2 family protein [Tessaracoccus oleiagri]|uniref:Predicted ATP-dependent carboligase, ATP-grasp superfamily n=1 Tax=Tessaracoccus oleiagri TaxID=686624 RepID=A0A1G9MCM6_9ACTN|nr:PAC2 family protein [Tessaracoccus oleiagri]SDL71949.1 Predicted ATP-dependent carboligase, ATP-grasp superfamily [Tessaracoccus oleiagri]